MSRLRFNWIERTIYTVEFYPTTGSCNTFSFVIIVWFVIEGQRIDIAVHRCDGSTITDITLEKNSFSLPSLRFDSLTQYNFWSLTITQTAVVPARSSRISSSPDISLSKSMKPFRMAVSILPCSRTIQHPTISFGRGRDHELNSGRLAIRVCRCLDECWATLAPKWESKVNEGQSQPSVRLTSMTVINSKKCTIFIFG